MEILLYLAILPVAFLMWYIHKKDVDKEPKGLLIKIFVFGCLSVIPIIILELVMNNYFSTDKATNYIEMFIATFMSVALIEELGKWVVAFFFGYNHDAYDHKYDAIVYAVFASLGFAVVENVLYVITSEAALSTAIMRAVLSVPSHACDGVVMGYFIGLAKHEKVNKRGSAIYYIILSILVPSIMHTIYDSLLFQSILEENYTYLGIFFIFVIIQYIICFIIINKTSKIEHNFDGTLAKKAEVKIEPPRGVSNFCPNCGNKIEVRYCSKCGYDTNNGV